MADYCLTLNAELQSRFGSGSRSSNFLTYFDIQDIVDQVNAQKAKETDSKKFLFDNYYFRLWLCLLISFVYITDRVKGALTFTVTAFSILYFHNIFKSLL